MAYWRRGARDFLSISILYMGIPKVMLPDPPHALGLYLTSTMVLTMVSGLVRFFTILLFEGKFGRLDTFIGKNHRARSALAEP